MGDDLEGLSDQEITNHPALELADELIKTMKVPGK